jgi:hypothetical protein
MCLSDLTVLTSYFVTAPPRSSTHTQNFETFFACEAGPDADAPNAVPPSTKLRQAAVMRDLPFLLIDRYLFLLVPAAALSMPLLGLRSLSPGRLCETFRGAATDVAFEDNDKVVPAARP